MSNEAKFSKEEIDEFRRIIVLTESFNQMNRINGRLALTGFFREHGKEKCDAMFAILKDEK